MRAVSRIAFAVFRESVRDRVPYNLVIFAILLIASSLLLGQLTFGFLESWSRTLLAILTAIGVEIVLARLMWGRWPHLASSYISGISIGMLVRSPAIWPYALCSAISITSRRVPAPPARRKRTW